MTIPPEELSREELERRLMQAERILEALQADEVDAVVGQKGALVLRLREVEEALQRSEARYRQLLSVLPLSVYTCDAEGRLTFFNQRAAELWGSKPEVGERYTEFLRRFRLFRDDVPLQPEQVPTAESLQTARPLRREELAIDRLDGSRVTVWIDVDPIFDDTGRLAGTLSVSQDVTDHKQTELQLRDSDRRVRELNETLEARASELAEANRRKDEFLAVLAHELRNPLSPIKIAAELLGLRLNGDEELRWIHETLSRQTNHMVRLIDDLMDVSRITRGKVKLRRELLDFRSVIHRCTENLRAAALDRGLHLSHELPGEPLPVDGDATRLEQIIGNLIGNAIKFSEPGGIVLVSGSADGSEVVVRVKDTGRGIAPEIAAHLFELFYQAEQGLSHSEGGLGIGLTMVKELTTLHDGTVEAKSDGHGKGAEFCLRLPRAAAAPETRAAEQMSAQHCRPPRRVLVVDDNRDAAKALAMLLAARGQTVRLAYSGVEALAAAEEFQPEIVLLDIGMPGMNGYEVARRLRSLPGGNHLLLVAVTGYGREEDAASSLTAGFDHHLTKPVELDSLEKLLDAIGNDKPAP